MLPIGIGAATALGESFTVQAAFTLALAGSVSMALPISTPPNSLAYGTGEIKSGDMARVGGIIALLGGVAIVWLSGPLLRLAGAVE